MADVSRTTSAGSLINYEKPLDLPLICSKCLGGDKNIRMVKDSYGAECKLCSRAFTSYRWRQTEPPRSRMQTFICRSCAEGQQACQSCILDIVYRIPLRVRDMVRRIVSEEHGRDDDIAPALAAVAADLNRDSSP